MFESGLVRTWPEWEASHDEVAALEAENGEVVRWGFYIRPDGSLYAIGVTPEDRRKLASLLSRDSCPRASR